MNTVEQKKSLPKRTNMKQKNQTPHETLRKENRSKKDDRAVVGQPPTVVVAPKTIGTNYVRRYPTPTLSLWFLLFKGFALGAEGYLLLIQRLPGFLGGLVILGGGGGGSLRHTGGDGVSSVRDLVRLHRG